MPRLGSEYVPVRRACYECGIYKTHHDYTRFGHNYYNVCNLCYFAKCKLDPHWSSYAITRCKLISRDGETPIAISGCRYTATDNLGVELHGWHRTVTNDPIGETEAYLRSLMAPAKAPVYGYEEAGKPQSEDSTDGQQR